MLGLIVRFAMAGFCLYLSYLLTTDAVIDWFGVTLTSFVGLALAWWGVEDYLRKDKKQ